MAFDGIDTPETNPAGGIESRDYLRSRLSDNATVRLNPIEKNRYGRTVAEIFLGESFINAELVREGHAWHYQRYSGNCPNRREIALWQLALLERALKTRRLDPPIAEFLLIPIQTH
ncbi:MAG: hypothetical protein GVY04_00845 [Cyanobacteria bacterium]|jgi:endonuclease YncB( thermonuclease family)|nr:hypothetical protein [Cyanobacteria bacterium GSL.Bin1]